MDQKKIGRFLKELRKEKDITQEHCFQRKQIEAFMQENPFRLIKNFQICYCSCIKSLYNLNTELETLIPSLKAIIYNKNSTKIAVFRINNKEC